MTLVKKWNIQLALLVGLGPWVTLLVGKMQEEVFTRLGRCAFANCVNGRP